MMDSLFFLENITFPISKVMYVKIKPGDISNTPKYGDNGTPGK